MTATTIRVQMAQRKDTAANWTAANPILLSGEIGYETDTKKFKIGDGTTNWNSLAYLPIADGSGNLTVTGNLEIGSTGSLTFEGSTANGFETTLAVTDPTADRTITLPNVSGTVVTTGDTGSVTSTMIADGTIVNADISGSAEIAVSKLANGTANQVIVTDGTNVSWSDNLTLAGDLTVKGTTTTINTQDLLVEDKNIIIGNVATPSDVTADGGGITLKGATDKTINWVDSTDAWTSSERFSYPLGSATAPALTFTGDPNTGIYSPGADQVAISTNGTGRLFVDASGRVGIGGSPSALFHLTQSAADAVVRIDGGSSNSSFIDFWIAGANKSYVGLGALTGGSNNDLINYNSSAGNWIAYTNSTERMRLDSSGRLGLGTSSATKKAEIRSAPSTADTDGARIGDGTRYMEIAQTGATYNYMQVGANQNLLYFSGSDLHLSTDGANAITFNTNSLERVRVDSQGRVAIGTTVINSLLSIGSTDSDALITSGGTNTFLSLKAMGSGGQLIFGAGGVSNGTPGTERARIDSSGRLLVGTSSDSGGALLQVNGDRVRIATAKTPASASDTGTTGEICWDANYIYVCTATNTWKRSAISTW